MVNKVIAIYQKNIKLLGNYTNADEDYRIAIKLYINSLQKEKAINLDRNIKVIS